MLVEELRFDRVKIFPARVHIAIVATPEPVNLAQELAVHDCVMAVGNYIFILPLLLNASLIEILKT